MPRFGFCGPSYRSQSLNADAQRCMNLYVEANESGQGKSPFTLYCTPGLKLLYQLGTAGIRGEITAQGRSFAVMGTKFCELLAPTAIPNFTVRGAVVSDGQPVSMAAGPNQILIASAGSAYVFDMTTNIVTPIPAQIDQVAQVGYSDGFFFALFLNSDKVQSSNPLDATTWPGLDVTKVSVFPDNVLALFFDHRDMWLFGTRNTQPYFDSGNFPFPFDVVSGGYIETGIAAPFSVAKIDNSLMWLGQDERGNGVLWRADGYKPSRVSNHAFEFAVQGYSRMDDAVAYAYQDQGHSFYVISFPTADATWVFDAATGLLHERGFWNKQAGVFTRHRAQYHTFNFGMHLVGDPTTGNVYQMAIPRQNATGAWDFGDDFGNVIRRERRAPHVSVEQKRIKHNSLQIDVETGLATLLGDAPMTTVTLADGNGGLWNVLVSDVGDIEVTKILAGTASTLILNDLTNTTSWQITVTTLGVLVPVAVVFDGTNALTFPFVSQGGTHNWNLQISKAGAFAILQTTDQGPVTRAPQILLRWSDDGGHTWSNVHTLDCGKTGAFATRVILRRLGISRDRVYEVAVTDPIGWRFVDAYLFTSDDPGPQERLVHKFRKTA